MGRHQMVLAYGWLPDHLRSGGGGAAANSPRGCCRGLGGGHYAVNCTVRMAQRALLCAAQRSGGPGGLLLLLLGVTITQAMTHNTHSDVASRC